MKKAFLGFAAISTVVQCADKEADKVPSLPDCAPLPSSMYSGYLPVTDTRSLYYIFQESMDKPEQDPIIVWFNGGPGCASLSDFFVQHGPFIFDDGETVIKPNPYPWNVRANILDIDSPAGVGFSDANTTDDILQNDMSTSQDAFTALQQFYKAFPEYRKNPLWISGESYAGIYSPYLAWQIHEWNLVQEMNGWNDTYNLKGFVVGNGMTDMYIDTDNPLIESLAYWCMIPMYLWEQIQALGCTFYWDKVDYLKADNAPECESLYNTSMGLIQDISIYDLFRTQYGNPTTSVERLTSRRKKRVHTSFKGDEEQEPLEIYLNRPDVRAALHIPDYVQQFLDCNDDYYNSYQVLREGSIWIYHTLLGYGEKYRMMHYSGDTDGAVATRGTRRWIQQQGWKVTDEWRPWTTDGQLSGYLEQYHKQFTFATVHGVGHEAPQWKRKDMQQLVMKFVHNEYID